MAHFKNNNSFQNKEITGSTFIVLLYSAQYGYVGMADLDWGWKKKRSDPSDLVN